MGLACCTARKSPLSKGNGITSPALASASSHKRIDEVCVRSSRRDVILLACFPAFQHLFYLFNIWPRGKSWCFVFQGPIPNSLSTACWILKEFPLLPTSDSLFICWSQTISAGCRQPTCFGLLSLNLSTCYLPAFQSGNNFQATAGEREV